MDEGGQPPALAGRQLLGRFLGARTGRTLQAYTADIGDFALFAGASADDAVGRLLGAGPEAARRLLLDYAVDRRRQGLTPATVGRRLATLRSLGTFARRSGATAWALEVPGEAEIAAAADPAPSDRLPYLFPRHAAEVDRLDVQHYALREALGANYLAPVEGPARVLDAGSGTGQWAFELGRQFPDALVVGLDLVPAKPDPPARYRWVKANLLAGLPFADGLFDFVHQRLLVVGVPLAAWPPLVAELARVTRPGGRVELVEPVVGVVDAGPATERFQVLAMELAAARGLDTADVVYRSLDTYLEDAGLVDVSRRQVPIPIGSWGGRIGSFMATDLRSAQARVGEVMQARSIITADECRDLLRETQEECGRLRMSFEFAIAHGRRHNVNDS